MNYQPQAGHTMGGPTRSFYVPSYSYGLGPLPAPVTTNIPGQGINPPSDIPELTPDNLTQPPPGHPPGRPNSRFPAASAPFYPNGVPTGPAAGFPQNQQQPAMANVNVNIFGTQPATYLGPAPAYQIRQASANLSLLRQILPLSYERSC
jgi:hypothetical protein